MIFDKFTLLNQTVLECFNKNDESKIVKAFVETGATVLNADFGFAWISSQVSKKLELVYKTRNTPYQPSSPEEGGLNYRVLTNRKPVFFSNIKKMREYKKGEGLDKNTKGKNKVSRYMKSFIIIPICFQDNIYGNIVFCFKKEENFSNEIKSLSTFIGSSLAQAITIHRLIESEYEARVLSHKNEAYFRALIKNSNEIIMLVDKKKNIMYVSSSVSRVNGHTPQEMIGMPVTKFLYDKNEEKLKSFLLKILKNPDKDHLEEFQTQKKDGSLQMVEVTALNMLNNPSIKGVVLNIKDITEKKTLELARENERLLAEEKQKLNFIADANHELRTPLAIIKGNVDLILKDAGKKRRRYADSALLEINGEIKHLTNILADFAILVRDYSAVQSRVTRSRLNISKLIKSAIKRCEIIARERQIKIFVKEQSVFLNGDRVYLERLFINLIRNAIFYGKNKGRVDIKITKKTEFVEVVVEDNGVGIGEEDLPYVFNRFYRVDKSHHSDDKRTGLGLAICKWIAEAHGGQIKVESVIKKGSKFFVILPLIKPTIR